MIRGATGAIGVARPLLPSRRAASCAAGGTLQRTVLALFGALALPSLAEAQTPPAQIDDSSLYWELVNYSEASGGPPYNVGWGMFVEFQTTTLTPMTAPVVLRFRQGTQAVGRLRCVAEGQSREQTRYACRDANLRIQAAGRIDVDAVWVDPDTDAETPLRTYTIQVGTVGRMRNAETPDATQQYVDYHSELLSTFSMPGGPRASDQLMLVFWMSTTEGGGSEFASSDLTFRCRVNGEVLPAANPNARPPVQLVQVHDPLVVASRYEGAAVNPTTDAIRFVQMRLVTPIAFGEESHLSSTWRLEDHPGHWECDLKSDGETVRTFRFDAEGDHLVPHAEQANGLSLRPGRTLVETVIPATSPRDFRTDPARLAQGGFFGRPWSTDAMRTLVAGVPAIGTPRPTEPRVPGFGPNAPTELMARDPAPGAAGGRTGGAPRTGTRPRSGARPR